MKNFQRIDMAATSYQETWEEIKCSDELCFQINHTKPHSESSLRLIAKLLPSKADSSFVTPPLQIDIGSKVCIGEHVFINHGLTMMSCGGIEIEDNVMIGPNVSLLTTNHDFKDHMVLLCGKILLKKNAWIGGRAIILPGITIGENAVVASGAVVTKDVPANTVVGGNPARIIRRLDANL